MPTLQQLQHRCNRLRQLHRGYLDLAMENHTLELIRERRANRNHQRPNNQTDKPRINFILTPRSIVMTVTETDLEDVVHGTLAIILGYVLVKLARSAGIYLMRSEAAYRAAESICMGRVFLLLVFDLLRMWYTQAGDLSYRLRMTAYVLAGGLWVWLWATWGEVPMF
ncbi:hypothetical protein DSL72_001901 [Monilinia vaccinii-corymbosi]|uniref:Uncharacterized protein n=1 Tax=Monilinia vaccinii-corymbosi TaxID=61207 RepID=A0A8A3PB57_9HELO|nr:hypothetical protein DSL72_001901 [Monilinia vaccinii-corymbosi]